MLNPASRRPFLTSWGIAVAAVLATPAAAQDEEAGFAPAWLVNVESRADHAFEADIGSGGSFDVSRAQAGIGLTYASTRRNSIGVSLDYGWAGYGFDGPGGFGALAPWDDVRQLSLSMPYRLGVGERWDVLAVAGVSSFAETGASFGDGVTASGILAVSYRVSENLTVGPGLGVASQIDDDLSVFPFLVLDWKVTPELSLGTRGDVGVVDGPQAVLTWRPQPAWSLGLGAGYESRRFRLDDSGPVPGGVGQDDAWPVYLSLAYGDPRVFQVYGFGGYRMSGQLTVEDRDGVLAAASGYDDAPFLGAGVRLSW